MQRLQRPELLRDDQRRVIRQHDAPRPDANRLCRLREVRDHDRRRCAGDPVQVVVLGDPVPRVAQSLGAPHKINRVHGAPVPASRPRRSGRRRGPRPAAHPEHTHETRRPRLTSIDTDRNALTSNGFPRLETPSARIGRSSRTRFGPNRWASVPPIAARRGLERSCLQAPSGGKDASCPRWTA